MEDNRLLQILEQIKVSYCRILDGKLTGIYIHGSIALGSFMWDRSDIDLLVVVSKELSLEEKKDMMNATLRLNEKATKKGIEMSVVLDKYCTNPVYPTPFDLHFSNMHLDWLKREPDRYCELMQGEDPDLASYFAVIKQSGIVLYGESIDRLFQNVGEEYYLKSVMADIEAAREEFLDSPMYHTLNLCRTLAYKNDKIIRSKSQGGEWALNHLPKKYKELVQLALSEYCEGCQAVYNDRNAADFCSFMFKQINLADKNG